jgi:hypothetical protein
VGEIVLPSVAEALSESNTIVRALFVARLAAEHVALAGKSPSATCITRSQRPSKALHDWRVTGAGAPCPFSTQCHGA